MHVGVNLVQEVQKEQEVRQEEEQGVPQGHEAVTFNRKNRKFAREMIMGFAEREMDAECVGKMTVLVRAFDTDGNLV